MKQAIGSSSYGISGSAPQGKRSVSDKRFECNRTFRPHRLSHDFSTGGPGGRQYTTHRALRHTPHPLLNSRTHTRLHHIGVDTQLEKPVEGLGVREGQDGPACGGRVAHTGSGNRAGVGDTHVETFSDLDGHEHLRGNHLEIGPCGHQVMISKKTRRISETLARPSLGVPYITFCIDFFRLGGLLHGGTAQ